MTAGYSRGFLIASLIALTGGLLAFIIPARVPPSPTVTIDVPAKGDLGAPAGPTALVDL
jgi:hypothetical protein